MITEKQVNDFEQKAKNDALEGFNDLLSSFKKQDKKAREISDNVAKYKKLLADWAEKAGYQIDWNTFTASHK